MLIFSLLKIKLKISIYWKYAYLRDIIKAHFWPTGQYLADDIIKGISLTKICALVIQMSMKFVSKDVIDIG